jgi:hypothetical protein
VICSAAPSTDRAFNYSARVFLLSATGPRIPIGGLHSSFVQHFSNLCKGARSLTASWFSRAPVPSVGNHHRCSRVLRFLLGRAQAWSFAVAALSREQAAHDFSFLQRFRDWLPLGLAPQLLGAFLLSPNWFPSAGKGASLRLQFS